LKQVRHPSAASLFHPVPRWLAALLEGRDHALIAPHYSISPFHDEVSKAGMPHGCKNPVAKKMGSDSPTVRSFDPALPEIPFSRLHLWNTPNLSKGIVRGTPSNIAKNGYISW
jgi:hypothetical protein